MPTPIRLAFVGCGNCLRISFGPVLPFVEGIEVVAAVDPSADALAQARDVYGMQRGYATLAECIKQETLDAVLIAAPVYEHRALAILCAEHHLHVLMEKPMARTPAECSDMIAAHQEAGTILMMAFMKRFNRSMLHVAGLLEDNVIGRVMGIRHNWDWGGNEQASFGPHWRGKINTWGGQWQDHGAHSVDLAHWWAGPVKSVMATFDITEPYYEVDSEYNVICTHDSGARSMHMSTKLFHQENEERYLIFGETGTISLKHASGVWQYTTPYEAYLHRYGRTRENIKTPFSQNWLEEGKQFGQYKVELDHFIACIREEKQPKTDGQSGKAVMEVVCAAYRSAYEHREIDLPADPDFDYESFFRSVKPRLPSRYKTR